MGGVRVARQVVADGPAEDGDIRLGVVVLVAVTNTDVRL